MKIGVIADDFTGASDIASFFACAGIPTVQLIDVPDNTSSIDKEIKVIVVSLKSRSCPVAEAISSSVNALKWLQTQGCTHFYFKYCSTFDSTSEGNIGPVTDALMTALNTNKTIICPSLPVNGRTVYQGYLFVGSQLLNESGMKDHPVTPMKDANLVRLMDAQSQGKTALVAFNDINSGSEAIKTALNSHFSNGFKYAVVDTLTHQNLLDIAEATLDYPLVTGGSGLAIGMAHHMKATGTIAINDKPAFSPPKSKTVILSGSCSMRTQEQVAYYKNLAPSFELLIEDYMGNPNYPEEIAAWVFKNLDSTMAPLVYATVNPQKLAEIQAKYGMKESSHAIESCFGKLCKLLNDKGISNFIVAGGETSGIVTQSLNAKAFHIGEQIAPGVPWIKAIDKPLFLALKSGNFGEVKFFETAQEFLK